MNEIRSEPLSINEKGYHPFFIVMVILLFHAVVFFKYQDLILNQITLRDFDGYWHLLRVNDLYKFGNLNETILARSNAPYGETLHWTSAFDLLLYAGAYIGSYFVDFNVALLWWSIILNPLLHALSFLVLFWGLRDLIGDLRASIFGILFPFQIYFFSFFNIGVPDHHGAQIFLFSLFFAVSIKSIVNDSWRLSLFCGAVGGVLIWFGIEGISVVLLALSVFGLIWVLEGNNYQINNLFFSFVLFLTTALMMLVDVSYDQLMNAIYDRVSIVHVFLFMNIALFWVLVTLLDKWSNVLKKRMGRIITAIIGATACIFAMHELFPFFFKNPLSEVNPVVKSIYLNQTGEFTGLFSGGNIHSGANYVYWAMTLPAIPVGIILLWYNRGKERYAWLFITLVSIFYIILSALIYRMIAYAIVCSLVLISYYIAHIYIFINNKYDRSYRRIVRTAFIVFCCFSFSAPSVLFRSEMSSYLLYERKFLDQVCQYLNGDPYFQSNPQRILTSIYLGPLLLYKTQHEVIGTPSHRNVSGILDTYDAINAKNAEDAYTIINRRGISIILIGRPKYGIGDYFIDVENNKKKSGKIFYDQLWKGNVPAWLQDYPVPKNLEGKIKVFKVQGKTDITLLREI